MRPNLRGKGSKGLTAARRGKCGSGGDGEGPIWRQGTYLGGMEEARALSGGKGRTLRGEGRGESPIRRG